MVEHTFHTVDDLEDIQLKNKIGIEEGAKISQESWKERHSFDSIAIKQLQQSLTVVWTTRPGE